MIPRYWVLPFPLLLFLFFALGVIFVVEGTVTKNVQGYDVTWEAACTPLDFDAAERSIKLSLRCGDHRIGWYAISIAVALLKDPKRVVTCRERRGQLLHNTVVTCSLSDT